MTMLTTERAREVLCALIERPSVNPMGRPWSGDTPIERPVTEYLESLFAPYGVRAERQPLGPMHESLRIDLPGRTDAAPTLFESHMDTVPADDWPERAFTPRVEGDLVYGRGACDDKGCLAAMALAFLDVLESGARPHTPAIFLAAGDEEYAQRGILDFRRVGGRIGRAIFGEPTGLSPVVQHRGTLRWDITVHGRSAHTARRELGENAIDGAVEVIVALREFEASLKARYPSRLTPGPALTVTVIQGGRTRNAVPDACMLSVDFRLAPGMTWEPALAETVAFLERLPWRLTHADPQMTTPALATDPDGAFSQRVLALCQGYAGEAALSGMPYGTDASWVSDRAPALVLGPGDIAYAHAIDERIAVSEVLTAARLYRDILREPWP